MSHVIFPSKTVGLDFAADALRDDLGERYTVTVREGARPLLRVSSSSTSYANVRLSQQDDGTHFKVHGGGFMIGRLINECTIARKVSRALRQGAGILLVDVRSREVAAQASQR